MAVLLRLCDEDRERFGGPEWVRFDEHDLDNVPWQTQDDWEFGGLGMSIDFLLTVHWPVRTARSKAAVVWLARTMADVETPPLKEFTINTSPNKLKIREDVGGDADPPGEAPSSDAAPSETGSD